MTKFKVNNDTELYYELSGKGDTTIVLIAGIIGDHKTWLPIANILSHKYQILTVDNRGVGQTTYDQKPFTIDNLADDTVTLIQGLNIAKPYIVGHSMGGAVAQIIAHKYPQLIKGAIFANTFIKFSAPAKSHFAQISNLYQQADPYLKIIDHIIPWVFSPAVIHDGLISALKTATLEQAYPQSAVGYNNQFNAIANFDSSSWVHAIKTPVLVIGSSEDKTTTLAESRELANALPNAVLKVLDGGHHSIGEQTDKLAALLMEYCV